MGIVERLLGQVISVKIINQVANYAATIIDAILISSFFGSDAISAYGLVMPVFMLLSVVGGTIANGVSKFCGNSIGSGDIQTTNEVFASSVIFGMAFSVAGSLIIERLRTVYKHYQELAIPIIMSGGIGISVIFISLADGFNTDLDGLSRLIRRIGELRPALIHLHNLHGYYLNAPLLFDYLRESGIPVAEESFYVRGKPSDTKLKEAETFAKKYI